MQRSVSSNSLVFGALSGIFVPDCVHSAYLKCLHLHLSVSTCQREWHTHFRTGLCLTPKRLNSSGTSYCWPVSQQSNFLPHPPTLSLQFNLFLWSPMMSYMLRTLPFQTLQIFAHNNHTSYVRFPFCLDICSRLRIHPSTHFWTRVTVGDTSQVLSGTGGKKSNMSSLTQSLAVSHTTKASLSCQCSVAAQPNSNGIIHSDFSLRYSYLLQVDFIRPQNSTCS